MEFYQTEQYCLRYFRFILVNADFYFITTNFYNKMTLNTLVQKLNSTTTLCTFSAKSGSASKCDNVALYLC